MKLIKNILVATMLLPTVLFSKNYYISAEGNDTNNGSIESPWKTLAKVTSIAELDSLGGLLLAGDSILFRSGDVFEGNLLFKSSGDTERPIVISSYGEGEKPVISGSGNIPGGDYFEAIRLLNASNIVVSNLWIKNNRRDSNRYTWGNNNSYGIYVYANRWGGVSRNLTFKNLKISDVYCINEDATFKQLKVAGIRLASDSNYFNTEVSIKDVLIEDCYFTRTGKSGVWTTHQKASKTIDSLNRNSNIVIRNNTFFETGGSGVILSSTCNALIENNDFDHTGYSNINEPRLAGRGSGAWVFSSRNVIAQYNRSYSIRGPGDSYGMHIDFGNRNVIFQYNYSEDSQGGFCEILGDNVNSTYRFNVSVNDGFRDFHGYSIWLSGFAGAGKDPIGSDSNFVYNNTIYLDTISCKPDISIYAKNSFIYNNIFHVTGGAQIGADGVEIEIEDGSKLLIMNNLFYGDIEEDFLVLDSSKIIEKDPLFLNPDPAIGKVGFDIQEASPVIDAGKAFPEPNFPMAGKGIFKDITAHASLDAFGNDISLINIVPNIGASNAYNSGNLIGIDTRKNKQVNFNFYPNPVKDILIINLEQSKLDSEVSILDIQGKIIYTTTMNNLNNKTKIRLPENMKNGIYFLRILNIENRQTSPFVLNR